MITEAIASRSMYRSPDNIAADLRARQEWHVVLCGEVAKIYAVDIRPRVFIDGEIVPLEPLDIPPVLTEALNDARADIERLQYELKDALVSQRASR